MSAPDSVHPSVLRPFGTTLSLVPRPLSTRQRVSVALQSMPASALAAAGIAAILTAGFISGRVLAVNLNFDVFVDSTDLARTLGAVSFLSIAAIVAAVGLGHRALATIRPSEVLTRHITTIVLGVAYLHLVLWVTRTISASVAAASTFSGSDFLPSVFWWG